MGLVYSSGGPRGCPCPGSNWVEIIMSAQLLPALVRFWAASFPRPFFKKGDSPQWCSAVLLELLHTADSITCPLLVLEEPGLLQAAQSCCRDPLHSFRVEEPGVTQSCAKQLPGAKLPFQVVPGFSDTQRGWALLGMV